ncbi:MAG TPA: hypothetical protein VFU09_06230 [Candidatus Udaeobacter sp.]|jgi:hypothetical protein|nr:hypothetical protein [Candidatus Udaeobacter sp.]
MRFKIRYLKAARREGKVIATDEKGLGLGCSLLKIHFPTVAKLADARDFGLMEKSFGPRILPWHDVGPRMSGIS